MGAPKEGLTACPTGRYPTSAIWERIQFPLREGFGNTGFFEPGCLLEKQFIRFPRFRAYGYVNLKAVCLQGIITMVRQTVCVLCVSLCVALTAHAYTNERVNSNTNHINLYQSINSHHAQGSIYPPAPNARPADSPIRVLVKLEGQPLALFAKQQRDTLTDKSLASDQIRTVAKQVRVQRQKMLADQQRLITKMQQQGLVSSVHRQFVNVGNLVSVSTQANQLDAIRQLPGVAAVYPERRHRALLDDSVASLGAPQVWEMRDDMDRPLTGRGMRVAILDTGIDYAHPDLGGCVGKTCKVLAGVDFSGLSAEGDESPSTNELDFRDYNGHGTHVAGIVAADGQVRGVAPEAQLYAVKVLDDSGFGGTTGIIAGIEWAIDPDDDPATDNGAHVMNLSLGGSIDAAMDEAVNTAMEAGVVVVVAAGNNGRYNSVDSPGSAEKVITVGAIDKEDKIASFSSRGPVLGDYIKPDLVAPGVDINSTWLNGAHKPLQGTSMAAPHVAGAAALLRQLHTQLSTAEIKALLVNGSRGLELDIFTQGAGALDLLASAQAQWLFTPSSLLLGRFTPDDVSKTLEAPLLVSNLGSAPGHIDLGQHGPAIPGTHLAVTGDSEAPVAPGEQRSLMISLEVDNGALPFSDHEALQHESFVGLSLDGGPVRLPFALIKSALLKLQMESTLEYVILLDKERGGSRYASSLDCTEEPEERELLLRPGHYQTVWMFADEPCSAPNKMVFGEEVQVDTVSSAEASGDQAVHELGLEAIIDKQGELLALDTLSLDNTCLNLWHPSMEYLHFDCGASGGDPRHVLRVSDIPEAFVLDYAMVISGEGDENKPNHRNLYLLSDKLENGLSAPRKISLDLATAGHFNLNVVNPHWNGSALRAGVNLVKPLGVDGKTGIDLPATISGAYTLPASFTLYGEVSNLGLSEWFAGIELEQTGEDDTQDDNFFRKSLLATGPVGFIDTDSYFKFVQDEDRLHVFFQSQDNESYVSQPGYYFSARPAISPEMNAVEVIAGDWLGYGMQKDETHNRFGGSLPFTVACDGEILAEDDFNETFFVDFYSESDCQRVTLNITMPTRFYDVEDSSRIVIDFKRQPPESFDNTIGLDNLPDWMEAPSLEDLSFLSDGQNTRLLTGEELTVRLRLGSRGKVVSVSQVSLAYRLEGNTEWTPLSLQGEGVDYQASLPVMDGSRLGSLQLTVEDEKGHRMTQTLNSVFYLGRDTDARIELPPVFGVTSEFTMEATGPLTDISLFSLLAMDPYGGSVVATLENDSLLPLGTHQLSWKAVGSTGLEANTIQTLHIVDTTPPTLTVPATSRVVVAVGGSADNPASPTAQDLVDGNIAPVPDQEGPFAEGEHTITWTATDNSGNMATAMQTLTVSVPVVTPAPSPGNNNSNSGGGGSLGFWWLLWMMVSAALGRRVIGRRSEV